MKTSILPDDPDPKFICPICKQPVVNYIQDAYQHVLFKHMDKVREMSTAEEVNLFLGGFKWEKSTTNQPKNTEQ